MTTHDAWEGVDVLVPKHIQQNRRQAIAAAYLDLGALIEALPTASPSPLDDMLAASLADADADDCKAWVNRVIRALPTQATEALNGAT